MYVKATVFKRLQQGDIGPLYKKYYGRLLAFAVKMVRWQDAEEFVNDAFVVVAFLSPSYFKEGERHVVSLLYVIVRNLCIDLIRKGKRRPTILPLDNLDFSLPEEEMVKLEVIYQLVRDKIPLLPPRCGFVVEGYMANMSTAKIAEMMHTEKKTVLSQKSKGIRILRKYLR